MCPAVNLIHDSPVHDSHLTHFNLYNNNVMLCLPAATVPVYSPAEADLVQWRGSHEETGTCVLYRVPLHGPLQTQRLHAEDAAVHQAIAHTHWYGDPRGPGGQASAQRHRYGCCGLPTIAICDVFKCVGKWSIEKAGSAWNLVCKENIFAVVIWTNQMLQLRNFLLNLC